VQARARVPAHMPHMPGWLAFSLVVLLILSGLGYRLVSLDSSSRPHIELTSLQTPAPAPVLPPVTVPSGVRDAVTAWILDAQDPTGAIVMTPGSDRVVPYFANMAALAVLPEYPDAARRYMDWYFAHLNHPDKYGLDGTIYDYFLYDGTPVSTGDYDSADSYAATFLILASRYAAVTGNTNYVRAHLGDLNAMAGVILRLQDADGLVWAKSNFRMKYIMDNAENYRGLMDWAYTLRQLGMASQAQVFEAAAARVQAGINSLWDSNHATFAYEVTIFGLRRYANASRWYPDVPAMLFPFLYGVFPASDPRAVLVYQAVNLAHPGWPQRIDSAQPWAPAAYMSVLLGDQGTASVALATAADLGPAGGSNWQINEAAFVLFALDAMTGATPAVQPAVALPPAPAR